MPLLLDGGGFGTRLRAQWGVPHEGSLDGYKHNYFKKELHTPSPPKTFLKLGTPAIFWASFSKQF